MSIKKSTAPLISRKYIFNDSMSAPLQVRRLGGQGSGQERRSREQSSAIIPLGMLLPFCVRFARNSQRCTHPPAQPLSIFVVNICSKSRISWAPVCPSTRTRCSLRRLSVRRVRRSRRLSAAVFVSFSIANFVVDSFTLPLTPPASRGGA